MTFVNLCCDGLTESLVFPSVTKTVCAPQCNRRCLAQASECCHIEVSQEDALDPWIQPAL